MIMGETVSITLAAALPTTMLSSTFVVVQDLLGQPKHPVPERRLGRGDWCMHPTRW